MVWACTERRRIHRQESDGDGGAREKKERKTKAEVVGLHQERFVGENCQGRTRKTEFKKHRPPNKNLCEKMRKKKKL